MLDQHLAESDRGRAREPDDAGSRPQRQRRHRDQVLRQRQGNLRLKSQTLLCVKNKKQPCVCAFDQKYQRLCLIIIQAEKTVFITTFL